MHTLALISQCHGISYTIDQLMADLEEIQFSFENSRVMDLSSFIRVMEIEKGRLEEVAMQDQAMDAVDAFVCLGGNADKSGHIPAANLHTLMFEFGLGHSLELVPKSQARQKSFTYRDFEEMFDLGCEVQEDFNAFSRDLEAELRLEQVAHVAEWDDFVNPGSAQADPEHRKISIGTRLVHLLDTVPESRRCSAVSNGSVGCRRVSTVSAVAMRRYSSSLSTFPSATNIELRPRRVTLKHGNTDRKSLDHGAQDCVPSGTRTGDRGSRDHDFGGYVMPRPRAPVQKRGDTCTTKDDNTPEVLHHCCCCLSSGPHGAALVLVLAPPKGCGRFKSRPPPPPPPPPPDPPKFSHTVGFQHSNRPPPLPPPLAPALSQPLCYSRCHYHCA